jgi:hypothetical protein
VRSRLLAAARAALVLALTTASLLPASARAAPTEVAAPPGRTPADGVFDRLAVVARVERAGPSDRPVAAIGASADLLDAIACQTPAACAHGGFAHVGDAPAARADGRVVAFAGDRGRGPGVFVSLDRGDGQRDLLRVAGEQWDPASRACAAPELGRGAAPASRPLCFADLDVDGPIALAHAPRGGEGLEGDGLTVAFAGTPSGPSRDDYRTVAPFAGKLGIWIAALEVRPSAGADGCETDEPCRYRLQGQPPRPVVQVGQSVEGRAIVDLAVDGEIGSPWRGDDATPYRAGEYGLLVRALAGDRELVLWASHVEPWTTSYYVQTLDGGTLGNLGCALGQRLTRVAGQENAVVLAFGRPRQWQGADGAAVYGTTLWRSDPATYPSTAQIAAAVRSYVGGYARCTTAEGPASRLTLVVGTNNYGAHVTPGHGQAWARMVNGLAAWAAERGLAGRVAIAGGSDMEVSYNSPAVTRAWVDGYHAAGNWTLFNFGDAAGCPASGARAAPARCANGWTQEDVWYISWGAPLARAVPEIYATAGGNAASWQQIVLYSALAHPDRPVMRLDGLLTQRQAIEQVCGADPDAQGCQGADNTPEQAWTQMTRKLSQDARTALDPTSVWSSDLKYCRRAGCPP